MVAWLEKHLTWILVGLGLLLLAGVVIWILNSFPPRRFTILTGREGGGYYLAAQEYQKVAEANGFTLEIRPTAGSVETLALLEAGEAGLGFVQGGLTLDAARNVLSSVAAVFYEPVWIFYRRAAFPGEPLAAMAQLRSHSVAIGEEGSGTNKLATELLADNGVTAKNTTLLALSAAEALSQLASGRIDAAYFVMAAGSRVIDELLRNPSLDLMSIDLAPAYTMRHRYLTSLAIPRGAIDLAQVIPAEDKTLLATVANLIVRNDVHPDLLRLITIAVVRTHERGGLFEQRFEFPNVQLTDLPVRKDELAYMERIKRGESLLDNYLPFWAAALVDRYLLFVLPVLLIVLPIISRSPVLYTMYMRSKITRWYGIVREVERRVPFMQNTEIDQEMNKLEELDDQLAEKLRVSDNYMPDAYNLRAHVRYVVEKLERRKRQLSGGATS